ncbi:hypothetical protein ABPG72_011924 [Tetrahymena utriculariae]
MKRKYLNYSFVFYEHEASLREIQERTNEIVNLQNQGSLVKQENQGLFKKFVEADINLQRDMITKSEGIGYVNMLFDILNQCNHNSATMMYVLPTIDGIILDDRRNIQKFLQSFQDQPDNKNWLTVLNQILQLASYDKIVYEAAARVRSQILAELDKKSFFTEQKQFLLWLIRSKDVSHSSNHLDDFCLTTCFAFLLKHEHLVKVFLDNNGAQFLHENMKKNPSDLQKMYYTLLVLWLISFSEKSVPFFTDPQLRLIGQSIEVIQKISREKLVRVAFACYKNLSQNNSCIEVIVDNDLLKVCETLLKGNIKEKEVLDDIQFMGEILEKNIRILTSYEKYEKEINMQLLEWSPVHTEKFWKENVKKFENQDYQMIKKLCDLLGSNRQKNIAIACYDIGEFCRFHPFGRNVIEGLEKKSVIMKLANDADPSIKENALLALQKIMLHNWNALSK